MGGDDGIANHQPQDCLLNRLFRRRSKKTSKLRVTGLCVENSLVSGEFPAEMASNAENVSIWWHHHVKEAPDLQVNNSDFNRMIGYTWMVLVMVTRLHDPYNAIPILQFGNKGVMLIEKYFFSCFGNDW